MPQFVSDLALASLDGTNGFAIDGVVSPNWVGYSVASAGDVNGDGFDDIIVGGPSVNDFWRRRHHMSCSERPKRVRSVHRRVQPQRHQRFRHVRHDAGQCRIRRQRWR